MYVYLLLAILFGSLFSILFKLFQRYSINSLQAILFNYLTALLISVIPFVRDILSGGIEAERCMLTPSGYLFACVVGLLFVLGFIVMDRSTWRCGVALTTITARSSLVLPVVLSWLLLSQPMPDWLYISMIIIAMLLIIVPNRQQEHQKKLSASDNVRRRKAAWALVSIFLVYGTSDFTLKYAQSCISTDSVGSASNCQLSMLMCCIFAVACLASVVTCVARRAFRQGVSWKNIVGGMALGLANNLCTTFILLALGKMSTDLFYPLYNIGIVVVSSFAGICLFHERIKKLQVVGVILAAVAITLLVMN